MPKYTPNLNIQLADPATDGNQTFNIDTMINNPVEKLDAALGLVPVSGDVRVATTGNIVLSGAQTIDGIALVAGNRVLVKNQTAGKENGIYTVATGAWTRTVDANSTAKLAAGICVYVEEGAANGKTRWQMANTGTVTLDTTAITFEKTGGAASATDAVIGSRTVSDTTAPTGDTGTVTTLFGWLASMIKAITGGATWRTLPGMSIAAIKAVLDAATNVGTASTLMKRDANGRAQVAAPSAAGDVARKDTVDGAIMTYMGGQYRADLNTATAVGVYNFGPDTLNKPIDGYGAVEVFVSDGLAHNNTNNWIWQRAVVVESGRPFNRMVWLRKKINNGAWEEWSTLSSETVADITYYVRTDGNDSNTGTANTAVGAFKTIGKAISMIPQIVNHVVTINVAAGTYAENVVIRGFHGGQYIVVIGTSATVSSFAVHDCKCRIAIQNFTISRTTDFGVYFGNSIGGVYSCVMTGNATTQTGIQADEGSSLLIVGCTISNRLYPIFSSYQSTISARENTGSGNGSSMYAYSGTVFASGISPFSTHGNITGAGGEIIPDTGVINPWGDNTYNNRVIGQFTHNGAWNVTANTDNYMLFNTVIRQSAIVCWDTGSYVFTAPQSGWYTFILTVNYYNATAGTKIRAHLVKNGSYAQAMGETTVYSGYTNGLLKGISRAYFDTGETARIAINPTSSCTIHNEMQSTNLTIGREF